jgi:hypothetical protein
MGDVTCTGSRGAMPQSQPRTRVVCYWRHTACVPLQLHIHPATVLMRIDISPLHAPPWCLSICVQRRHKRMHQSVGLCAYWRQSLDGWTCVAVRELVPASSHAMFIMGRVLRPQHTERSKSIPLSILRSLLPEIFWEQPVSTSEVFFGRGCCSLSCA